MTVIIYPDPIELLGAYLAAELDAYGLPSPVTTKAPDDPGRPGPGGSKFVRLSATERPAGKVTQDVQVIADVYAEGEAEAHRLAQLTRGILAAAAEHLAEVAASEPETGPYATSDPRTELARFTTTATVRIRGTVQPRQAH